ncbi:MAG: protein rep [Bacteroidota bacterium]
MATALAEYARWHEGKPEGELVKSYRSSIYCGEKIEQEGGVLTSRYCGHRWCLICNRIRMGKAINAYEPEVSGWTDPQLVTLTVQNAPGDELRMTIEGMVKGFSQLVRKLRRDGHAVRAIRKLECTYNAQREDYHPHFHVVVEGERAADAMLDAWLRFGPKYTGREVKRGGQDVRPLDVDGGGLRELFKYFTKLTAKTQSGGKGYVGVPQLDVMFRAMRSKRVYQPYGFRTAKDVNEVDELDAVTVAISREDQATTWLWDDDVADWVDLETGECLTGHAPDAKSGRFAGYYGGPERVVEASERAPP